MDQTSLSRPLLGQPSASPFTPAIVGGRGTRLSAAKEGHWSLVGFHTGFIFGSIGPNSSSSSGRQIGHDYQKKNLEMKRLDRNPRKQQAKRNELQACEREREYVERIVVSCCRLFEGRKVGWRAVRYDR